MITVFGAVTLVQLEELIRGSIEEGTYTVVMADGTVFDMDRDWALSAGVAAMQFLREAAARDIARERSS